MGRIDREGPHALHVGLLHRENGLRCNGRVWHRPDTYILFQIIRWCYSEGSPRILVSASPPVELAKAGGDRRAQVVHCRQIREVHHSVMVRCAKKCKQRVRASRTRGAKSGGLTYLPYRQLPTMNGRRFPRGDARWLP
jgi:hypothetical protein